ncbi:MAG: DMT family transporter [Pseudomonadota bacterium]|nr:DMT family transporter [Pseudomonadota bacterium]
MVHPAMLHIKLIIMSLIWATSYPLGRWLAAYGAPEAIVVSRVFIAFLFLCLMAKVRNESPMSLSIPLVLQFFVLGFFGFCVHNYLMFEALEHTQAGKGAIINGAIPAIVMLLDFLVFRRRIGMLSFLGVGLSFFGVLVVVSDGRFVNLLYFGLGRGEILFLVAILGWSLYSIIARPLLELYRPIWVTAYPCLCGAILMLPFLFANLEAAIAILSEPFVVFILLVQGILTMGLGFLWYYEGIKYLGPVNTSVYLNLVPVFGVTLAFFAVDEIPSFSVFVGGGAVVAGVWLTTRKVTV